MAAIKGWIIYFNPHSPRGERLHHTDQHPDHGMISIHVPREGSDGYGMRSVVSSIYFNPRSPRGERLQTSALPSDFRTFQSTLPARGATQEFKDMLPVFDISIHAPRGGATPSSLLCFVLYHISIHAPHGGTDSRRAGIVLLSVISIHAPHGGSDLTMMSFCI